MASLGKITFGDQRSCCTVVIVFRKVHLIGNCKNKWFILPIVIGAGLVNEGARRLSFLTDKKHWELDFEEEGFKSMHLDFRWKLIRANFIAFKWQEKVYLWITRNHVASLVLLELLFLFFSFCGILFGSLFLFFLYLYFSKFSNFYFFYFSFHNYHSHLVASLF